MDSNSVPILFPVEPREFWKQIREIIKEEVSALKFPGSPVLPAPGFTEKPLYKITEICELFGVSRTTIHDWVKHGKLRKVKVRSRVYFLAGDIQRLLKGGS